MDKIAKNNELYLNYVPDCIFPCDNEFEIPSLRLDMQPKYCEIPFVLFGEQARTFQMNGQGTLHFYTDDYRFGDSLFQHPEKILKHNPANIVEPNYSLFNETPIAFGLQQVYKKRFISRSMQERGIKVFADLNVAPKFYKLNMLGIPKGYQAFCTRGYEDRLYHLEFELKMAEFIADGNPLLFVVYGGGIKVKRFCREHQLIHVTPTISIKKKVKNFDKMKEVISFFGQPLEPMKTLPTLSEEMEKQVIDYSKKQLE
mgnify:CR=1 FL=1